MTEWLIEYRGRLSATAMAVAAFLAELTGLIDAVGKALGG